VNQEAKKFELTDDGVNDGILNELQKKGQGILEILGITYTVVSVEAKPDADAERNFIKKMTDHKLNVIVEQSKIAETSKLTSRNMEEAIIGQVADGKIDMKTALEQLSQSNRSEGYNKLEDMERVIAFVRKLQTDNIISDDEAGQRINEFLRTLPAHLPCTKTKTGVKPDQIAEKASTPDTTVDDLLSD
jgi:G:T/U-mismatch repair DNA glycosylase